MYLIRYNSEESAYAFTDIEDTIDFVKSIMCNSSHIEVSNYADNKIIEQIEIDCCHNYIIFKTSIFKKTKLVDFYNSLVNRKNVIYDKAVVKYYDINGNEFSIDIVNNSDNNNFLTDVNISIEYFKATSKKFYLYLYDSGNSSVYCCECIAIDNWSGPVFCTTVEVTHDVLRVYKRYAN